jgi:hypothetical protein
MIRILGAGLNIALLAAVLAGCGSESFTEVETTRSPLFPGFESYASREEVMPKLSREVEIKLVEESALSMGGSTPPYRIYALSISPYPHLEQPGKLLITFYNNRLLQTAYYPENIDEYVKALRRSGVAVENGRELIKGHTMIWIGVDFDNVPYVGWADKRLRDQQRRWFANYK